MILSLIIYRIGLVIMSDIIPSSLHYRQDIRNGSQPSEIKIP